MRASRLGPTFRDFGGACRSRGIKERRGGRSLKEISDLRSGGSGFSFADYSADLAGILFAGAVVGGHVPLERLEKGFLVRDFLPDLSGLKEGIAWDDFLRSYGSPLDPRFVQERQRLLGQIIALPGYKIPATPGK